MDLGFEVGVPTIVAAALIAAWSPPSEIAERVAELQWFWKLWVGYGLAFTVGMLPCAARLVTVHRPVQRTALLVREFDNRTHRPRRVRDSASRTAATLLAELPLDYRERGEEIDLFRREEPYVIAMIDRYRTIRAALLPRCGSGPTAESRATVLAGLLTPLPGEIDDLIDRFDENRRLLALCGVPEAADMPEIVALTLDSGFEPIWGVDHGRSVWDLYYATKV